MLEDGAVGYRGYRGKGEEEDRFLEAEEDAVGEEVEEAWRGLG